MLKFQLRVTKAAGIVLAARIVIAVVGELADLGAVEEIIEIVGIVGGGAPLDPAQHLAVRVARERDGAVAVVVDLDRGEAAEAVVIISGIVGRALAVIVAGARDPGVV